MTEALTLFVNGRKINVENACLDWTLLRYLREVLKLMGVKQSCDNEGTCGACTVIINGRARRACLTKLSSLNLANIETIESLQVERGEIPHPLVQTVIQDGIFQCGYCAPGALLSAKSLLDETLNPSDKEIEKALSTVICRCASLNRMDQSVKRAAAILRGDELSSWTPEDTANEERILDRVTGRQKFTADLTFPEMVYVQAVRAGVPHAEVISIDYGEAERMPGILKVLTAQDIPGKNRFGSIVDDQPVFCDREHKVRHAGDALGIVVGKTPDQVAAAVEAVKVVLLPLPVVTDQEMALRVDAPVVQERLNALSPDAPNVLRKYQTRKGNVEAGFLEADLIIEGDYEVPFVEHAYMELECSIAVPEPDGSITIYCGTQGPMEDRHQVAAALGIDKKKVRIAHMFMGGGFGGKEDITGQIHTALAAHILGRPAKSQFSRAESMLVSTKRHAIKMHYKTGAKKDGSLIAAEVRLLGDTGPYASVGEAVLFRACVFSCGPYVLPNVKVDSFAIHTNNGIGGAFRGYGSPQVAFAAELQMQKIADALGIDPIAFRLKNALGLGDATITGDVLTTEVGVGIKACLNAVKDTLQKTEWPEVGPDEKLGVGIAAAYKNVGFGSNLPDSAGARISLESDGTFLVRHGATDMGQGINEVMAMIAARVLDIPVKYIKVHTADTKYDPPGGMTTASRQTFISGNATKHASLNLRDQLWKIVSEEFSVPEDAIKIRDGFFVHQPDGRVLISLQDLANGSQPFESSVTYEAPKTQPPPTLASPHPTSTPAPMHFAYDYGAQAAMVAVNTKTGAIRVLKVVAAHDVGKTISKRNVIGQIEGAVVQGIGYALSESFPYENGMPKIKKFKDLGLLRFRDVPQIVPIIVEDPHPFGPFGAKGMGELTITPTAPAIANAIHDAVGVWINDLPITKEKVLAGLQAKLIPQE